MEDIAGRIAKVYEYYNLSAATFADKIGVQRSGLSHILTGRNKPSLDFIIKITEAFEAVDLNWLVHGKGSFPKNTVTEKPKITESIAPKIPTQIEPNPPTLKTEKQPSTFSDAKTSDVVKIMLFYSDGTFEEFSPR